MYTQRKKKIGNWRILGTRKAFRTLGPQKVNSIYSKAVHISNYISISCNNTINIINSYITTISGSYSKELPPMMDSYCRYRSPVVISKVADHLISTTHTQIQAKVSSFVHFSLERGQQEFGAAHHVVSHVTMVALHRWRAALLRHPTLIYLFFSPLRRFFFFYRHIAR